MTSTDCDGDDDSLRLRPATGSDGGQVAEVYLAARRAAEPHMPPEGNNEDAVRCWIDGKLHGPDQTWVAEQAGMVVGYARATPTWLDDLYVLPDHQGGGVGTALLDLVKATRPDGFRLWAFEANAPARAFYRHRGLIELQHTDGTANQEAAPDVLLAWPGEDPIAFLRARIDEVDEDLARLLQARAVLTESVQRLKPVPGEAGRDADRERQIAERIAVLAPQLGAARISRIVHTVITESLDAART